MNDPLGTDGPNPKRRVLCFFEGEAEPFYSHLVEERYPSLPPETPYLSAIKSTIDPTSFEVGRWVRNGDDLCVIVGELPDGNLIVASHTWEGQYEIAALDKSRCIPTETPELDDNYSAFVAAVLPEHFSDLPARQA